SVTAAASILGIVTAAMFIHHRFFMYSPLSIAPGGFVNGDPGSPDNCAQARRRCSPRNRRSPAIGLPVQPPTSREGIASGGWGARIPGRAGALEKIPADQRGESLVEPGGRANLWRATQGNDVRANRANPQSHQWFDRRATGAAGKDFRGAASPEDRVKQGLSTRVRD